jgi:DNA helicase-2/ATP-dependent DNA helicase PcrA
MALETRLFGPPGTGKTYYLKGQVARLAETYGPESITLCSFSRTAATELRSRINSIPESAVNTLHGFAKISIGAGKPAEDPAMLADWNKNNPGAASQLAAGRNDDDDLGPSGSGQGDEIHNQMQVLRARQVDFALWPAQVRAHFTRWSGWKRANNLLDFTDWLEVALQDVDRAPGTGSIFFADEAQDFSPLELALCRKWGSHADVTNFVLAGDDDQTVFGFKGASVDAFLNPPVPPEQRIVLAQSYRVPLAVQRAATAWINQVQRRQPKEYSPRRERGGEIVEGRVRTMPAATWRSPTLLLRDIEQQLKQGRTCMVLASAAFYLGEIIRELRAAGLPFHNPYQRKRGDWNPLHPGSGVSASQRLLSFLRPDAETWGDKARLWTPLEYDRWFEVVASDITLTPGAKAKAKAFADGLQATQPDDSLVGLQAWIQPLVANSLLDQIDRGTLAMLRWLDAHLLDSKRAALKFPFEVAHRRGGMTLLDDPKVVVGTIHSVKGAEADVVYLCPDLSPAAVRASLVPGEGADSITRTFYVGMTRAREELVLLGAAGAAVRWDCAIRAVSESALF